MPVVAHPVRTGKSQDQKKLFRMGKLMRKCNLLGSSMLRSAIVLGAALGMSAPAWTQVVPTDGPTDEKVQAQLEPGLQDQADEERAGPIVVTGSRIRRTEFNSPDPIVIIDPELAEKQGQFSVAEMLQSSTVASGSNQVTSAISSNIGRTPPNGGLGAETISLRGLGAERTLVLLNGRRAGPAGSRGSISAFDLNVLPQSIVKSVEILKTGASSIYGSDAVAGVVNLITKRDTNGLVLDGFVGIPGEGGGEEYRASALYGKDFGRGHIMIAADYFQRKRLEARDRDYLDCPEAYIFRKSGERADLIDPRTGAPRCYEAPFGQVWLYSGNGSTEIGRYQPDSGDNLGQYIPRALQPGLGAPGNFYRVNYDAASNGVENGYLPAQGLRTVVPDTKVLTGYLDASYELTDNIEFGVELLHSRRRTASTRNVQWWASFYTASGNPGGADPISAGWTGNFLLIPTTVKEDNHEVEVNYTRALASLRGNFGDLLTGWSWDSYLQYSRSDSNYTDDVIYLDAIQSQEYRTKSCAGTVTAVRKVPCIDVNFLTPDFLTGRFTQAERDFLFGQDTGNTLYTQWAGEVSTTGSLFRLPAGPVQVALGVAYRRDEINDVPGEVLLSGNVWRNGGRDSGSITAGHTETKEAFGEIQIPLIRDTPFIQDLSISGAARLTNVKSVRTADGKSFSDNGNWTYSIGANWAVNDWLRFRGRYGTSFRAPALYEQFLLNRLSGASQRSIDPCIGWTQALASGRITQRVADNCAAAGVPGNQPSTGTSATVTTGGGLGLLKSETSTAKSASVVFTPKFSFLPNTRFNLAVDYFDIEINDEITTLDAGSIIRGCYNSEFFPDDPLCDLFSRRAAGTIGQFGIGNVTATFINISKQRNRGIDVTANLRQDLGKWGTFSFLGQMTWQLEDSVAVFSGTERDLNGQYGEPKWTGDFNFVYSPDKSWSIFYGLDVIGKTSDEQDFIDIYKGLCRTDTTYGEYCVDLTAPTKFYHSASVTKELDNFKITFGVRNFLDTKPPRVTAPDPSGGIIPVLGKSLFASSYDFIGRRFFVNVSTRF